MKLFITTLAVLICFSMQGQTKKITLTISYIHKEYGIATIEARRGYQLWKGNCKNAPDSLRLGVRIIAIPVKRTDTCNCIFKRYK